VTDELTNGAECVIEHIDYRVENSTRPSIIWVSFQHPDIGRNQHRENAHFYKATVNRNWTPVFEVTRQLHHFKSIKRVRSKFSGANFHLDPLLPRLFTIVKATH